MLINTQYYLKGQDELVNPRLLNNSPLMNTNHILIDFSKASDEEMACFDDINDLDMFFLRLQAVRRIDLYEHESVIIFDEVQLFPKARQAI